jgi:hypothetical protein
VTKISQLSSIGDSLAIDDQFLIRDVDDGTTPNKSVTVSGITRALPLGSATAPALAFASDKNTGLFSPGADQVSVATNGVERLRVNATGQVGAVSLGTNAAPAYSFTGDPNTGIFSPGADQLAISTNGTGRLFVTSLGRVGVNTDSPAFIFQIQHTTEDGIRLRTANTSDSHIDFADTDANGRGRINYDHATDSMGFRTAGTERMRLDSSGRLGLGTSSPSGNLDVRGLSGTTIIRATGADTNGNADVEIFSTGTGGNSRLYFSDTAAQSGSIIYTHNTNLLSFTTNATTAVTIDSSQRVGIGTTSPDTTLTVSGSGAGIRVQPSNVANATIFLRHGSLGNNSGLEADSTGALGLYANGSERGRFDNSGRFLVGTSTTADLGSVIQTAQTTGAGAFEAFQFSNNTAYPFITFAKSRGASAGTNTIVQNGDPLGEIVFRGADGTDYDTAASITAYVDGEPGTAGDATDMPGRLVFSVTADGSASPTEALRITNDRYVRLASGSGGIQFNGDTAAANALDDYEEGTWTPTCFGSATAGTYTPSSVFAYYTRIGNQVTVIAQFGFSAATGGTGNVRFAGLPFSYKANAALTGACRGISVNTTSSSSNGLFVSNTSNSTGAGIFPILTIDNAAHEEIPISGVTTSSSFGFTLTYTVS